jgi:hypothetical protein
MLSNSIVQVVCGKECGLDAVMIATEGGEAALISLATTSIHQSTTLPTFSPVLTMAIARPIRMLGAACIILCFFIVFQIRKSPAALTLGGSKMRDPLLDRTLCDPILIWP